MRTSNIPDPSRWVGAVTAGMSGVYHVEDAKKALLAMSDLLKRPLDDIVQTLLPDEEDDDERRQFLLCAASPSDDVTVEQRLRANFVDEPDSMDTFRGWDAQVVEDQLHVLSGCVGTDAGSIVDQLTWPTGAARAWLNGVEKGDHHNPDGPLKQVYEARQYTLDDGPPIPGSDWTLSANDPLTLVRYAGAAKTWAAAHRLAVEKELPAIHVLGVTSLANANCPPGPAAPLRTTPDNAYIRHFREDLTPHEQQAALAVAHRMQSAAHKHEAEHPEGRRRRSLANRVGTAGMNALNDVVPIVHPSVVQLAIEAANRDECPAHPATLWAIELMRANATINQWARDWNIREIDIKAVHDEARLERERSEQRRSKERDGHHR